MAYDEILDKYLDLDIGNGNYTISSIEKCLHHVRIQVIKECIETIKNVSDEGVRLEDTSVGVDAISALEDLVYLCEHCGGPISKRNPSGYCDHLHYPEYCKVCSEK